VRELRNIIERAMILEDGDVITMKYLPRNLLPETGALGSAIRAQTTQGIGADHRFSLPPEGISLEEVELSLVRQAIERSEGNQTRAAEFLAISRDQLRYRLKKLESSTDQLASGGAND
jgi:DNA-binding NtrC family response regulator